MSFSTSYTPCSSLPARGTDEAGLLWRASLFAGFTYRESGPDAALPSGRSQKSQVGQVTNHRFSGPLEGEVWSGSVGAEEQPTLHQAVSEGIGEDTVSVGGSLENWLRFKTNSAFYCSPIPGWISQRTTQIWPELLTMPNAFFENWSLISTLMSQTLHPSHPTPYMQIEISM